jgi:hypothetical protein
MCRPIANRSDDEDDEEEGEPAFHLWEGSDGSAMKLAESEIWRHPPWDGQFSPDGWLSQ